MTRSEPPRRSRRIEPLEPGGEPVCLLTADVARNRRAPIDRLLALGDFAARDAGYEVRLPAGDESWTLANQFAEEERLCCPALGIEIEEQDAEIVLRASF